MTILFMDGFDHVDTDTYTDKYDLWEHSSQSAIVTTPNRWASGNAARIYSTLNYVGRYLPDNTREIWIGGAVRPSSLHDTPNNGSLLKFIDADGEPQVSLKLTLGGSILVYRGYYSTQVLLGSSAGGAYGTNWQYLEVRVKIGNSDGEVEIRVNEQPVLNLSSVDTRAGTEFIKQVHWMCSHSFSYVYWDDLYIDDAQFHGNCRVRAFLPDADGTYNQLTRSGGSNDYEAVDDNPSNEDTDYIYGRTTGLKSTFGITTGEVDTVKAVQLNHHAKLSSGARRIKPLVRSGGADYYAPLTGVIGSEYLYRHSGLAADPQDGNPWTQAKLEAAEFGIEIAPGTTTTSTTTTTTTT